jgi:hypothetical protein
MHRPCTTHRNHTLPHTLQSSGFEEEKKHAINKNGKFQKNSNYWPYTNMLLILSCIRIQAKFGLKKKTVNT